MLILRDSPGGAQISLDTMTEEAAQELGSGFAAIDPWAHYKFSAAALAAYLAKAESGAPRYVIRIGGALAGAVGIRSAWLRGPYLQFLGILPAYQGQGAGQLVLAWFEGTARAHGERNIWVAASDFNSAALKFYETHGFQRAARLDGLLEDGETEILLRKKLIIKK
ncbi:MAG: GNAT family N-acetyltransferase [Hyphomicrobium sp.]|nr:GNAT family N-acetyltransferase [Hyphomicrobium sp.]